MLVAYLLLIVGIVWLVQILVKDRLAVTLPKVRWQPTPGETEKPNQPSFTGPPLEEESLLGRSKTVFSQPAIPVSHPPTGTQPGVVHELLESPGVSEETTSLTEFTQFPGEVGEPSSDHPEYSVNEDGTGADDEDVDVDTDDLMNGNDTVTLTTFSDRLKSYPDGESQSQPNEFMIPLEES